jgi:DNA-binding GntR family transcriptional regulator
MNKLIPGNRLLKEMQVFKIFGVSRFRVRKATKSLEFRGIIEKRAE